MIAFAARGCFFTAAAFYRYRPASFSLAPRQLTMASRLVEPRLATAHTARIRHADELIRAPLHARPADAECLRVIDAMATGDVSERH